MRSIILLLAAPLTIGAQTLADLSAGKAAFELRCGNCHGADGTGGGYAPIPRTSRAWGDSNGR